mgnify:CR=1
MGVVTYILLPYYELVLEDLDGLVPHGGEAREREVLLVMLR